MLYCLKLIWRTYWHKLLEWHRSAKNMPLYCFQPSLSNVPAVGAVKFNLSPTLKDINAGCTCVCSLMDLHRTLHAPLGRSFGTPHKSGSEDQGSEKPPVLIVIWFEIVRTLLLDDYWYTFFLFFKWNTWWPVLKYTMYKKDKSEMSQYLKPSKASPQCCEARILWNEVTGVQTPTHISLWNVNNTKRVEATAC